MKKRNKIFKIASALVVLCLITTCAISTTFAKYATGDSGSDTARVAKWGVTVSTSGTLFGKDYGANTATEDADRITAATSQSVSATDEVVAPGTKNDVGFQIKVVGQPEVSWKLGAASSDVEDIYLSAAEYGVMVPEYGVNENTDFTASELYTKNGNTYEKATAYEATVTEYYSLHDYVNVTETYNPIVWTGAYANPNDDANNGRTATYATLTEAAEYIVGELSDNAYNANEDVEFTYTLTWAWNFGDETSSLATISYNDKCDTILGNLRAVAAGEAINVVAKVGDNYSQLTVTDGVAKVNGSETVYANLEVAFNVEVIATQVD